MRQLAGSLLLIFLASCAAAQNDKQFLRDYAETRGFRLGRPTAAKATADGSAVLFLRAEPRRAAMSLYLFDTANGRTRCLLTPEQILRGSEERLSPEEKARRERQRMSVGGISSFQLSEDGEQVLLGLSGKLYLMQRRSDEVRELNTGSSTAIDPKFAPDGRSIAFVRDYDLHVLELGSGGVTALTTGGTEQVSHGLAEFVAQEEMSRFSGYWWSPDSRFIAYEEADARQVEVWYVADPARPSDPPFASRYPRPGHNNVAVRLGIKSIAGGDTVWVNWDAARYPYLGFVRWDEHGPLLIGVQSRDQKDLLLLKVDRATGRTTELLHEHDDAWVNLPYTVPRWVEDPAGFLWVSERTGGPQLELRDPGGKLVRMLVPPDAGFDGVVDVDANNRQVCFSASTDPTQSHLWRTSLDGGTPVRISSKTGHHGATFSKNHQICVRTESTLQDMPISAVYRADGTLIGELPSVAENPPFVPSVEMAKVGKGPGFYTSIVRPRSFDARQRYPVIVDVYGGPHGNHVSATMGRYLLSQWMADQGFIVISLDGRGTPGRGRDWERAIFGKLGAVPLEDQVAGLQALAQRYPEIDAERVGIVGWSFGGYLSALAVLRRPDIFKAAAAGAPVTDWLDYDTHYTERYMGMPDTDAAAYREASLLTYAADLRRPLLLIHGTADDNVYFRHSLKLANALFRQGNDFELLPLSGSTHMVPDPIVTQRLESRIILFFRHHLK